MRSASGLETRARLLEQAALVWKSRVATGTIILHILGPLLKDLLLINIASIGVHQVIPELAALVSSSGRDSHPSDQKQLHPKLESVWCRSAYCDKWS